nr:DNA helicase [Tanacetum cinerariifolium]
MIDCLSIVKTDKVNHTVEINIVKLVVEIESFGMSADELDKETRSSDRLQPKQANLSCVHALNGPHLHEIHVIPCTHEADQSDNSEYFFGLVTIFSSIEGEMSGPFSTDSRIIQPCCLFIMYSSIMLFQESYISFSNIGGRLSAPERIALSARVVIEKFGTVISIVVIAAVYFGTTSDSKALNTCGGGQIYMQPSSDPPDFIKQLLTNNHFMEHIRAYNQMFAMTSFGAKVKAEDLMFSKYLVKSIFGSDLFSQKKYFSRVDESAINPEIMQGLIHVLDKHNGLVMLFRTARDRCISSEIPAFKIRLYNMSGVRGYELPTSDLLGGIVFKDGSTRVLPRIELKPQDSGGKGQKVMMNGVFEQKVKDFLSFLKEVKTFGDGSVDPRGYKLVTEVMMHGPCGAVSSIAVCMQEGSDIKHFPKTHNYRTFFDSNGQTHYQRRGTGVHVMKGELKLDNCNVVPYNRALDPAVGAFRMVSLKMKSISSDIPASSTVTVYSGGTVTQELSCSFSASGSPISPLPTRFASLLLPAGRTTHSRFKLPLELTDESLCHTKNKSQLGNLLVETDLIIWDEASINDKCCFETLDRTLRDLMSAPNVVFGGKTIVLGGNGEIGEPDAENEQDSSWVTVPTEYTVTVDEAGMSELIDFIFDDTILKAPTAGSL